MNEKLALSLTMLILVPNLGQPCTTLLSGPLGLRHNTYRSATIQAQQIRAGLLNETDLIIVSIVDIVSCKTFY